MSETAKKQGFRPKGITLPVRIATDDPQTLEDGKGAMFSDVWNSAHARYLVQAANEYPEAIDALRDAVNELLNERIREAGRMGFKLTLPELRKQHPRCFETIDRYERVLSRSAELEDK